MPIYEYRCERCGAVFSELRRIAERDEPAQCPNCGGPAKVILSPFATGSGSASAGGSGSSGCSSGFG
jgi:putative FmdB family regulatory protein